MSMQSKDNKEIILDPASKRDRAIDIIAKQVRSGERVSVSKAMREAGYSKNTAKQPHKITQSKRYRDVAPTLIRTLDNIATLSTKLIANRLANKKTAERIHVRDLSGLHRNAIHDGQLLKGKNTENVGGVLEALEGIKKAIDQA